MLTTTQLATYLRVDPETPGLESAIALAVALVAAEIGTPTLSARTITTRVKVPTAREAIELPEGPATLLEQATSNGDELDPSTLELHPWSVWGELQAGSIALTYVAGWGTEQELPERIRQAILVTAATAHSTTDQSITSVKLGDYSVTREATSSTELSVQAKALVRPWRRAGL